jgi:SPP1 gp7 family putative phage head morphogenesis protein
MCKEHNHIAVYVGDVKANAYDPTRSTMLRNIFVRDSNRRFNKLVVAVRTAIQRDDVFGLSMQINERLSTPGKNAYINLSDSQKIERFIQWLEEKFDETILEISLINALNNINTGAWTDSYIQTAYKKGIIRARSEMKKLGKSFSSIETIDNILLYPEHLNRMSMLFRNVFNEYKGIASTMETLISRLLSEGFVSGLSSKQLADRIVAIIDGSGVGVAGVVDSTGRFIPGKRRAEILIRTEITRAHHLSSIQEYRNQGVTSTKVLAEFVSMNDERVCSLCENLNGNIFTLNEIESIIPVHPQCRCFAQPYIPKN